MANELHLDSPVRLRNPRLLGELRIGAAVMVGVFVLAFRPHDPALIPSYVRPAGFGLATVLAAIGLAQLLPAIGRQRPTPAVLLAADAGIGVGLVWLYAADAPSLLYAILLPVQVEAAMLLGLPGGSATWAVTTAAFLVAVLSAGGLLGDHPALDVLVLPLAQLMVVGLISALRRELAAATAATEQASTHFRALVEQVPAIVYAAGCGDGDWRYVSPQITRVLGMTPQEWTAHPPAFRAFVHPEDRDRASAEEELARLRGDDHLGLDYRLVLPDGRTVWIRDESTLVRDRRGRPYYWHGVLLDVTAQKRVEAQLREAEAEYRTLVEQIPAVVYRFAPDAPVPGASGGRPGRFVYISPQIESVLGYTRQDWLEDPRRWARCLHPEDRERVVAEDARVAGTGDPLNVEYRLIARDGHVVWVRDQAVLLGEGGRRYWHGVMLDVTERKRAEEEVAFLAYHDRLTGLPNRTMFEELLGLALARARRQGLAVAALYLDLDDFKLVNDGLGHAAGDDLLRQVAIRLRGASRDTDLVARQGGDEFLLLLSDLARDSVDASDGAGARSIARGVAARIHETLRAPFVLGDAEVFSSVSIGVSLFPLDAADGKALLKNADTAMYRSKASGPGGTIVFADTAGDPVTRLSFSTRLHRAVERRDWVLHYHPMVDLATGDTTGVEALLRWRDPNGGLIAPGDFLPTAEEMGLTESIGDWVLEELCRQAAVWRGMGLALQTGLNLSGRQLWQPRLVEKVLRAVEAAGLAPESLLVEVAESTAMREPVRTGQVLSDLHEAGVRVAIDDFGIGYSSLARLRHLPVDILKIDPSFVHDVPEDEAAAGMVAAIVQLAHGLGMTPLAEGIENEVQRRFLVEHGCRAGQGCLFGHPVPGAAVPDVVRGRARADAIRWG